MDEVQRGGVNIKPDNNIVGFGKTDFGRYGSDNFSVRIINWHKDCPFGFRLWSGKPFESDSVKLGDFTYQANFIWQTYISNSYTLERRICGMHDLYFEFDKTDLRIDFGGFEFIPKLKAYEKINATDNDVLHGDTFEIAGNSVLNIGNNVFFTFSDMNFVHGTSEIRLTGKTHHDNDTIHLVITPENGDAVKEIIEFPYSDESITVSVKLPDIRGNCDIEFRFLPGCDFDFDSFEILKHPDET